MQREPLSGWVDTGEVKLHYWEWPGKEPTMLCVHGITANGRAWDMLAHRLNGKHRMIAVDLRGRGLSDKPPAGQYGLVNHVRDLSRVIDALGISPAVIVGHSMGGALAALVAAYKPEAVSAAVIVDYGIETAASKEERRAQLSTSVQRLSMVFPSLEAYFDYWKPLPFIQPWTEHFESYLTADVEERADGSVASRVLLAGVEEDFHELNMPEEHISVLGRVRAPSLLLWAPEGLLEPQPLFSRQGLENMAGLLPDSRLLTVEDANHFTIIFSRNGINQVAEAIEELLGKS